MAAALVSLLCSCSVKEERTPCPCWLGLDISGCVDRSDSLTLSLWGERSSLSEEVCIGDYPNLLERMVEKGIVTTAAVCGYDKTCVRNGSVLSKAGEEAYAVLGYVNTIDCTGEEARDSVALGRQTARIHLAVETNPDEDYPYELSVAGDVCGLMIRDLSPVKGEFGHRLHLDSERVCTFRLYRQLAGSRPVIIVRKDGQEVDRLPLYDWIRAVGYDWSAPDLEDIFIGMDYAKANVTITVSDWQNGDKIHITI